MRGKSTEVSQVVPAWNWSDQKIMSPFFWIMYSREGWKLQVSRENFESSFLISLPKSLAKYAESNSGDHKLIWSGSLELHKQTMHYSWANWAFALLQQTGTSRNVLASFTWLTGPLGRLYSLQSRVERREGCWYNQADWHCDVGAVMGSPYEFTYGLLVLCLSAVNGDQKSGVHKNEAGGKDCLGTSVPVC